MKAILAILLTAIPAGVHAQAERKFIRQGNRAFDDGKYPVAEISYRKALEKDTSSVPAGYNLGNALYKEKQYDAAASRYEALAKSQETQAGHHFNLGNALYQAGKYKESIEAYKNALRKAPGDTDAKHNLQLAMNKLHAQQNQQNQQNQKNQKNQQPDQNQDKGGNGDPKQDAQNEQSRNQDENDGQQDQRGGQQNENQNVKGQISKQDAERILQALENEEKDVLKKVQDQKKQGRKAPVDKNW